MGLLAGVGTAIAGAGAWLGGGIAALGVGEATAGALGAGLVDAGVGAGLGAGEAAVTGGDVGQGALLGGITGGAIGGLGPLVGDTLGIGATGADALVGAGAGALGAGVTGGNPLTGALEGGVTGGITGSLSGGTSSTGATPGGTTAPGASAASIAPPPGVSGVTDLTAGFNTGGLPGDLSVQPTAQLGATGGISSGAGPSAGVGGAAAIPAPLSVQATNPLTATVNTPTLPADAAGGTSSVQTAIDNPTSSNIWKALGNNAAPLVAGAGLLTNLVGNQSVPGQNELGQLAGGLQTEGQQRPGRRSGDEGRAGSRPVQIRVGGHERVQRGGAGPQQHHRTGGGAEVPGAKRAAERGTGCDRNVGPALRRTDELRQRAVGTDRAGDCQPCRCAVGRRHRDQVGRLGESTNDRV